MDFNRAREILESSDTYEVYFMGSPIWITDLHVDRMTADVAESRETTSKTREVAVRQLIEGEKVEQ